LITGSSEIANTSIGWHLASGRWIFAHDTVPRTDPFSFTAGGAEWIDHEWLFQILVAATEAVGGSTLLVVLRAVFVAALAALLFRFGVRSGLDPPVALVLTTLCLYGARIRFFLRPELFTLLIVPAVVWLYIDRGGGGDRRWLLKLALLMMIGANAHAGVLVAPPLLAVLWFGEWFRSRLAPKVKRASLASGALGVAVAAIAPVLNPYGWRLYTVPVKIAHLVGLPQIPNPEWISPSPSDVPPLYVALAVGLVVLAAREREPVRWLLFVVSGLLALRYVRNVGLFFSLLPIATAPALASLSVTTRFRRPSVAAVVAISAAVLVALSIFVTPPYRMRFDFSASFYPIKACDFMERENLLVAPGYNDVRFGGYLINRCFPPRRVFLDDRNEINEPLLREIHALLTSSDQTGWHKMLLRYGVATALLRYNPPFEVVTPDGHSVGHRGFSALWFPNSEWALLYWDDTAMVLARRSSTDLALLERFEYRFVRPDDLEALQRRLIEQPEIRGAVAAELTRALEDQPDNRRALAMSEFLLTLEP
jgi:hypothetical protein